MKGKRKVVITPEVVTEMLGAPTFLDEEIENRTKDPGGAVGLAWTPAGGEVLFIEASRMQGGGSLTLTGQLGDVMKESGRTALSWFRAHAPRYSVDPAFYKDAEIHLHVPSGAIPKDGPSAGITMATAMISALARVPARKDVAMTGEITLRGKVLPIGGVKEKLLAAHRAGVKNIVLPKDNEKDLADIPKNVLDALNVFMVENMDEVLKQALEGPVPWRSARVTDRTDPPPRAPASTSDAGAWRVNPEPSLSRPRRHGRGRVHQPRSATPPGAGARLRGWSRRRFGEDGP